MADVFKEGLKMGRCVAEESRWRVCIRVVESSDSEISCMLYQLFKIMF